VLGLARSFALPVMVAALSLLSGALDTARSQTLPPAQLPAMKFVTANRVLPATAASYYGTATTHTNSLFNAVAGAAAFATPTPEIVETARALKSNPDTIFEFVHNQIRTEFAFGERKGPLGTLIDKSGTPFDQNVLFGNLVSQAGYPVQYQIGQVTIQAADFANWTGVSDIGAACRMLSSGAIPAQFSPAIGATCSGSGSFNHVVILHIWTQVCIGGTTQACTGGAWYAYDKSFKTFAGPAPVDLAGASGLTASGAVGAACPSQPPPNSYCQTDLPPNPPSLANVNANGLNAYLTAGGTSLLNYLKKSAPALDTDQVTGVTKIQPIYAPAGGWRNATPPGYTTSGTPVTVTACSGPQTTATYACNIPDQYRTQLQVSMTVAPDLVHYVSALNWTFFADDVDGRRLAFGTNFNDNTGALNPASVSAGGTVTPLNYTIGADTLTVDDQIVQSWSCPISFSPGTFCYGAQSPGQVTLTATHPYALNATTKATFADETVVKQLVSTATPVTIVSGWGLVSPARLAKWSDEVANDTALPSQGVAPWVCGNEGGGEYDYCFPLYPQSSGDLTRQKLAAVLGPAKGRTRGTTPNG
jgi:hypothetical protein